MNQEQSTPNKFRYIRIGEVESEVGLSRSEIYRKVKSGDFPKQYKLGRQSVAWRDVDVEAWKLSREQV